MSTFNMVASMNESTVVAEYTSESRRSDSYQSEAELEKEFIRMLTEQSYEYLQIHLEAELIENLKHKLEQLNGYDFTDSEWERFFREYIANANEGIVEKTRTIQVDYTKVLKRDDGSTKNIRLIDKGNIHNNRLQVINQYEVLGKAGNATEDTVNPANYDNRYDVTILVNGLPLVHIELKRRGVAIREAFNQINRYQRDSFWSGCGLYEYVQIFIISNGTNTKYYSNTTRFSHLKEQEKSSGKRINEDYPEINEMHNIASNMENPARICQDKSFSEYDAILKDLNSDLYGILASVLLKHGKISCIKEFIESVD